MPSVSSRSGVANLLRSITKDHPLVDGNKRLGWMATAVFLDLNGHNPTSIPNDDVYTLVIEVAAGDDHVPAIADRLRKAFDAGRTTSP